MHTRRLLIVQTAGWWYAAACTVVQWSAEWLESRCRGTVSLETPSTSPAAWSPPENVRPHHIAISKPQNLLTLTDCTRFCTFLQRVSIACYAKRWTSYRKSVCLTACLSQSGIVSKRLKLGSWDLHWRIAPWLYSVSPKKSPLRFSYIFSQTVGGF